MDKLLKRLKALDKELPDKIDKVVQANGSEMAQTARRLAPRDVGQIRQSIRKRKVREMEAAVTAGARHSAYMEFGTGGKFYAPEELQQQAAAARSLPKGTFAEGLKSIKGWARRQGIEESAAFPIFMSILKNGLKPQPFMYPALKLQEPQLEKDIEDLLRKTLGKI